MIGSRGPQAQQQSSSINKVRLIPKEVFLGLQDDFARGYLFSGEINPVLYDDNCVFTDPTLSFKGLKTFQTNIENLKPVIKRFVGKNVVVLYSLELKERCIVANWRMLGALKLPWSPRIDIDGETVYTLNPEAENGRIISYSETWKCPPATALLQLLVPAKSASDRISYLLQQTSVESRFGAINVQQIKNEIQNLANSAETGDSRSRQRIRDLVDSLKWFVLEGKSTDDTSALMRYPSGEWKLVYTETSAASCGRFGPFRGSVIQNFVPTNDTEVASFYNDVSFGPASIRLDAFFRPCQKSPSNKFIIEFRRINYRLLTVPIFSTKLGGRTEFWKMLYTDKDYRCFTTNTGKLFILSKQEQYQQ